MLDFLFRRLTADPARGAPLFAAVTAVARQPHWYVEGRVPDTLDGRFAMLATVTALALIRLEQLGSAANLASVALTERFIEVMEAEHRELGIGDPALGRTVRKLVGSLSRRVDLWRTTVAGGDWGEAVGHSVYKGEVTPDARDHCSTGLRAVWAGLEAAGLESLEDGRLA
ncbi:MAG: ubiquinol-cytochrome C chaperone family protein [Sphingomicrobium sp.]